MMPNYSFKPMRLDFCVRQRTMHRNHLTLVALAAFLSACGPCGSNDDAVSLARGLSQQRLADLFQDIQSLNPDAGQGQLYIDTRTNVHDAFKDLDPQSITTDGYMARVHLSGCVDDKVLLIVKGLDERGGKEITLLPGEARDPVVLWQSE
jgi:hypothetical protein